MKQKVLLIKGEIIEELFEDKYDEEDNEYFKDLVEAYSSSRDDENLKDLILDLYKFSMTGPWPEKWLNDNAEAFNINTLEELNETKWVKDFK